MDGEQRYEELRQHIHALLSKYESFEIHKMVEQVASSRPPSTVSFSASSQLSRRSTDSRFSTMSADYAPSLLSSTSSRSRPRYDPSIYRSGLNPTKPSQLLIPPPTSEVFSPMDTISQASPLSIDCDSSSIASSATRPSRVSANEGCWFCTFCTDHKSFSAKSDWKKHETRHHETGEDWPCPFRNCLRVFDREADFIKHCQRHHPSVNPPTDIKIQLLPRVVYGCGFDGCKAVLMGWKERCNHVADQHMKKEGMRRSEWKYSNVIRNLLRQDATRNAWKELFSTLETKHPRYQITWRPENTRILKQKLECGDMRPNVDVILHTALSLREGRPYNDVVELDPSFRTPSRDSIPNFHNLSQDQRNQILKANPTKPVPPVRLNPLTAPTSKLFDNNMTTLAEPHPGTLVEFDIPSHTGGNLTNTNGRRISYIMDVDQESLGLPSEPDPQIPPGLDLDPYQFDTSSSSRPIEIHYQHSFDNSPMFEESSHQRRSSRGHIIQKSIKHFTNRLSPK